MQPAFGLVSLCLTYLSSLQDVHSNLHSQRLREGNVRAKQVLHILVNIDGDRIPLVSSLTVESTIREANLKVWLSLYTAWTILTCLQKMTLLQFKNHIELLEDQFQSHTLETCDVSEKHELPY